MPSEKSEGSPRVSFSLSGLNFDETELTLCLPGETRLSSSTKNKKRAFSENFDLTLGCCSSSGILFHSKADDPSPNNETSNKPPAKARVVGWPPVKSSRKNMIIKISCKYVKVAADGAPYLRKVDLKMYSGYKQLLAALEDMFTCLIICNVMSHKKKLSDAANGILQYVPTYEDRDVDWMLVGDVPWKMFVESCKRIRLMKSSEATELPRMTSTNGSSTC